MPCYKMGRFIGEALESVGKQTYTNWEVIAVDDCGPGDGTKEAVESFAKQFPNNRIIYHRHEKNGGVSAARNTAIGLAQGEYLAFLDPDDIWMLEHLTKHMAKRKLGVPIPVTASGCQMFDSRKPGKNLGEWSTTPWEAEIFPISLVARNYINPSCVVTEKQVIIECGGFDENPDIQHVEDWDLWLRLGCAGVKFKFIHENTVLYRRHSMAAAMQSDLMESRKLFFYKKHIKIMVSFTGEYLLFQTLRADSLETRLLQIEMNYFVKLGRIFAKIYKKYSEKIKA